jgi:hypothetical protein
MAVHKGPASFRPRCNQGGSPVAAMPIYYILINSFKGGSLVVVLVMHMFCLFSLDMNKHVLHFATKMPRIC